MQSVQEPCLCLPLTSYILILQQKTFFSLNWFEGLQQSLLLKVSRPLIQGPVLSASTVPSPSEGSSSTWCGPRCRKPEKKTVMWTLTSVKINLETTTGVLPADDTVQDGHQKHGEGQVPGETHGDEHHVAVIAEVPLWSVRRVEDETDLRNRGGGGGSERSTWSQPGGAVVSLTHLLHFLTSQNQVPCRTVRVQRSSSSRMLPRWKISRKATSALPKTE